MSRCPRRSTLFPYTTLFRSLEESRTRLRGLGPVNLLALEEYSRKKERFTFLTQQREDLHKAKAQLLEAIEKRSEEHTSELQSLTNLVCRLLLEKKKKHKQKR